MSGSVSTWIEKMAAGDEWAASKVYQRFSSRMIRLSQHMVRRLGLLSIDYEDITQQVMTDLSLSIKKGRSNRVINRRVMWKLLERMAWRRALDVRRREQAVKRQYEQPEIEWSQISMDMHLSGVRRVFEEELEMLGQRLDEQARAIVELLRRQFSIEEIASELNISPRTVCRRLVAIKDAANEWNQNRK